MIARIAKIDKWPPVINSSLREKRRLTFLA
jgi:hypothetical protein